MINFFRLVWFKLFGVPDYAVPPDDAAYAEFANAKDKTHDHAARRWYDLRFRDGD